MKILLMIASFMLIAFTLICGFWIGAQEKVDKSSVNFHMWLALLTTLVVAITIVYLAKKL